MDTPTDQTPASTPAATAPAAPAAPAAATGARLSAEARRAQLVDVAHDILRRAPLEPLSPEQVAAEAGVSKPLVFHYFPTVADLQIAVFQHVTEDLVAHLTGTGDLPLDQRLRAGVEAYIDYADTHADLYVHLTRGGGSPARMQVAMDAVRNRIARLIGEAQGIEDPAPALMVALRGYVGMIEESVLEWLTDRPVPRAALVDWLCAVGPRIVPDTMELLRHATDAPAA